MDTLVRSMALALCFLIVAGTGGPAGAERSYRFFVDENEATWAMQYMAAASARRLLHGYPGGGFKPNAGMSRAEVVAAVMRLLRETGAAALEPPGGVSAEIEQFDDAATIAERYPWAAEDIGAAAYLGFVDPSEGPFDPGAPAARWWIATLLVKALGLDAEAQARMGDALPFADSSEIPEGASGYVAVASDAGIMTGYDGDFGPMSPVTRAEFAAVLTRCCDALAPVRGSEIRGVVRAVDAKKSSITVRKFDSDWWPRTAEIGYWDRGAVFDDEVTMTMAADAAVFVEGKAAALSSIKKGHVLAVAWDDRGFVTLVDARAKSPASWPETGQAQRQGTVVEIAYEHGPVLVFRDQSGKTRAYAVGSQCKVNRDGKAAGLSSLEPYDRVTLKVVDSTITAITAEEPEEVIEFEAEIRWISLGEKPRLGIVDDRSVRRELRISPDCVVIRHGRASNLAEVGERDSARIRVTDDEVTSIDVRLPEGRAEAEGVVREVALGSAPRIRIRDMQGDDVEYPLSSGCIVRAGRFLAALEDVGVGDRVILGLESSGNSWSARTIDVRQTDEASGWVEAVQAEWAPAMVTVRLYSGTTLRAWVSPDAKVWRKGKAVELDRVNEGDRVKLSLLDGVVTRIEAEDASAAIEGVVESVDERRSRLTVKPQDDAALTVAVAPDAKITYLKQAVGLGEVESGDRVQVKMKDGRATSIVVEDRVPITVTGEVTRVSSGSAPKISVKPPEDSTKTYALASDVRIEYEGYPMVVADLVEGDRISLTVYGSRVTRVSVERRPRSETSATFVSLIVDLSEGYAIRVRNEKGAVVTYKVVDGADVSFGSDDLELTDLVDGDILALKLAGNLVTHITVLR